MIGKAGASRMAVFSVFFFVESCRSAPLPGNCQEEVGWLRFQLSSLGEKLVAQDQLIQDLRRLQSQAQPSPDNHLTPEDHTEYTDCSQVFGDGNVASGLYMIRPKQSPASVMVFCDMTDGGGWTVLQRRRDGRESFDRSWVEYKQGFGDLHSTDGEFWLGNDPLHYLTSQGNYSLRINLEDFDGKQRFAEYTNFTVGDEKDQYELQLGEYTGDAGDALPEAHPEPSTQWNDPQAAQQRLKFSTYDHGNHGDDPECMRQDKSGWWFSRCHSGNLNGHYYNGPYHAVADDGVVWYTWHGYWYSIRSVVMMMRPAHFEENKAKKQ